MVKPMEKACLLRTRRRSASACAEATANKRARQFGGGNVADQIRVIVNVTSEIISN